MRLVGSKVPRGVSPSESGMWKAAKGDQRGGKRVGSGGPEGLNGKAAGHGGFAGSAPRCRRDVGAGVGVTDPGRQRAFWLSV